MYRASSQRIYLGRPPRNNLFARRILFYPIAQYALGELVFTLTMRELQVVKCAARGKTNKVIACELGLSEHTVKNYLFRAFEKLEVSNRVELLFYLTQRGHIFTADQAD